MQKHSAQSLVDVNASDQKFKEKILKIEPLKDCEELEGPFTSSLSQLCIPDLLRKT